MESEDDDDICSSVLYKDKPEWKDVKPIYPSKEEDLAVKIAVPETFTDAFAFLRAVLITEEASPRVMTLLDDCIDLNSANYTVWQYRRDVIFKLNYDLHKELRFLDSIISESPKNYQVWHHRRVIVDKIGSSAARRELTFTEEILNDESKNYHAWQHRQWVARTFNVDLDEELSFSLRLLLEDPRNNSAFNYRYFLLTINDQRENKERIDVEVNLAKRLIEMIPHNESAWSYLSGLLLNDGILSQLSVVAFVEDLYERTEPKKRSSFMLSFLNDYLREKIEAKIEIDQNMERSLKICDELYKVDTVRKNYWKN